MSGGPELTEQHYH